MQKPTSSAAEPEGEIYEATVVTSGMIPSNTPLSTALIILATLSDEGVTANFDGLRQESALKNLINNRSIQVEPDSSGAF